MEKFWRSSLRKKIDMQCNYYFHLHYQLNILKAFVPTEMSTMCPGMGSPTSYTLFNVGCRLSQIPGKEFLAETVLTGQSCIKGNLIALTK